MNAEFLWGVGLVAIYGLLRQMIRAAIRRRRVRRARLAGRKIRYKYR